MIRIRVEQIWDAIGQIGTTMFDMTAVLIGSGILAALVTLCVIWSSAWLVEKVAPKFSDNAKFSAWRTTRIFGGAIFAQHGLFC